MAEPPAPPSTPEQDQPTAQPEAQKATKAPKTKTQASPQALPHAEPSTEPEPLSPGTIVREASRHILKLKSISAQARRDHIYQTYTAKLHAI